MKALRAWLSVAVVLALLGACSSTSRRSDSAAEGSQVADAVNSAAPSGDPETPQGAREAPSRSNASVAGPAAAAGTDPAFGSIAPPSTRIPGSGPGISDKEVVIGVELLADPGSVYASLGINGISPTEEQQRQIIDAIFDFVNARGGLAGRRAIPLLHFTDIANGTHASRAEEACTYFTQDHKVFAVIAGGNTTDAFAACLAKTRTPLLEDNGTFWPYDQTEIDRYAPYLYLPTKLSLSRFDAYIEGLHAQGFFKGDVKIGLLRYDTANEERTSKQVIVPALARIGKKLTSEFLFTPAQTVQDLGRSGSEANAAVLQFRTADIDRVIYLPSAQVISLVFPIAAEEQNYHPRHGINSAEGPNFWAQNAPEGQLVNTIAVGWRPLNDLPTTVNFDENPRWKACADFMRKRGVLAFAAYGCSSVFMLQEGLRRADRISAAGLRAGVDKLGATAYSASNFATYFRPGRSDGPAATRNLAYATECGCFKYTSSPRPID